MNCKALLVLALAISIAAASDEIMLAWNVTASVASEKGILRHASGTAKKGSLHAIIGPSGSGKSTVINVLSNNVPKGSLELRGIVTSEETVSPIYVAQDDLLFAQLTSEETLETSGILRSKKHMPAKNDLRDIATKSLNTLGLKKVRATKVGDSKTRGLSGGEKKRLSIGNELIGDRSKGGDGESVVIFADEPTSGLDSFQAQNVMSLLRELADQGNTVLTAIHQPRASIVAMFDDITLLSEGEVCYTGPADEMTTFFASIGFPAPSKGVNPVEYLVDLISVDYASPEAESESRERLTRIQEAFAQSKYADSIRGTISSLKAAPSAVAQVPVVEPQSQRLGLGWAGRLRLASLKTKTLLVRAWRTVCRDKALNIARFASSTFSALLFGAIYFKLGKGAGTVPDRLGLLQVAAVNTAMTSLIKATTSFVQEKFVVNRERRSDSYSVASYFLSKLVAEAPLSAFFPCFAGVLMYKLCGLNPSPGRLARFITILTVESFASSSFGMLVGSYAQSTDAAIATAPALMVVFIVFGGLYVVNTPAWLSFVPRVSLIRWAYEALCVNEFEGLELVPEARIGPKSASSGSQVLEGMGMGGSTVRNALLAQAGIIAFNYAATYLSLVMQKPRFEKILPYEEGEEEEEEGQGREVKTLASADGIEEDLGRSGGSTKMKARKRRSHTGPPSMGMKPNAPPSL